MDYKKSMELKSYIDAKLKTHGLKTEWFNFNNTGKLGVRITDAKNHTTTHTIEDARIITIFLNGHQINNTVRKVSA